MDEHQPMTGSALTPQPQGRRWLLAVALVVLALVVATGSAAIGAAVGRSSIDSPGLFEPDAADPLVAEVEERFTEEYPGWTLESITTRECRRGEAREHTVVEYVVTTAPEGRDFTMGIAYTSTNGNSLLNTDRMFREDVPWEMRAESVWEVLEKEYVAEGRTLVAVRTNAVGNVLVEWERSIGSGLERRYWYAEDLLWRDETAHAWVRNPGL